MNNIFRIALINNSESTLFSQNLYKMLYIILLVTCITANFYLIRWVSWTEMAARKSTTCTPDIFIRIMVHQKPDDLDVTVLIYYNLFILRFEHLLQNSCDTRVFGFSINIFFSTCLAVTKRNFECIKMATNVSLRSEGWGDHKKF